MYYINCKVQSTWSVLTALLLVGSVYGQTTSGTISGAVQDSAGAIVPGAKVTVINEETGLRTETATTSSGAFVSPALPPGRYTVFCNEGRVPNLFGKGHSCKSYGSPKCQLCSTGWSSNHRSYC